MSFILSSPFRSDPSTHLCLDFSPRSASSGLERGEEGGNDSKENWEERVGGRERKKEIQGGEERNRRKRNGRHNKGSAEKKGIE